VGGSGPRFLRVQGIPKAPSPQLNVSCLPWMKKIGSHKIYKKCQICGHQMCFFSSRKCTKTVFGRGSAPDPAGGAHDAPPDPVVGWGGGHPLPILLPFDAYASRVSTSAPSAPRFWSPPYNFLGTPLVTYAIFSINSRFSTAQICQNGGKLLLWKRRGWLLHLHGVRNLRLVPWLACYTPLTGRISAFSNVRRTCIKLSEMLL